jgi:phosphinothricin acetyltransferase
MRAARTRSERPRVRDAAPADLQAIQAIYVQEVEHGTASFELVPPDATELARRREAVLALGLPYLVAILDERLCGYAYAAAYRPRAAYAHTAEVSVYVADWARRRGVGRALLDALIDRCERTQVRQLVAIIGDSAHAASIALHAGSGFRHVGTLENVGYKLGRWLDSVIMQRSVGAGAGAPPGGAG